MTHPQQTLAVSLARSPLSLCWTPLLLRVPLNPTSSCFLAVIAHATRLSIQNHVLAGDMCVLNRKKCKTNAGEKSGMWTYGREYEYEMATLRKKKTPSLQMIGVGVCFCQKHRLSTTTVLVVHCLENHAGNTLRKRCCSAERLRLFIVQIFRYAPHDKTDLPKNAAVIERSSSSSSRSAS